MDASNDDKWAALEAKYPCSEELSFLKHLMYKPVTLSTWMPGIFLRNGAEKETGYYGKKLSEPQNQWVIYPVNSDHVCFKSCKDELNLSIHIHGEMGYGMVTDNKDIHETPAQQFKPSKGLDEGKYFFVAAINNKECC